MDIVDLWEGDRPALSRGLNNTRNCSQANQTGCVYEDQLFARQTSGKSINRRWVAFLISSTHLHVLRAPTGCASYARMSRRDRIELTASHGRLHGRLHGPLLLGGPRDASRHQPGPRQHPLLRLLGPAHRPLPAPGEPAGATPAALAVKCKLACELAWPRASGFPGCAMAFSH